MQEKERILLLQIKCDLFDSFEIIPDQLDFDFYLQKMKNIFQKYFSINDFHLIIHKRLFLENQYMFTVLTGENISYLEDWQALSYFSDTSSDRDHLESPFEKKLLLKDLKGDLNGVIVLQFADHDEYSIYSDDFWDACATIGYQYLKNVIELIVVQLRNKQLETLQKAARQINATLDVKRIFSCLFTALRDLYPHFLYRIYITHDEWLDKELPILFLDFSSENSPEIDAFKTGKIIRKEGNDSLYQFLYIPLKGRQGIYGVLEVATSNGELFGREDIHFMYRLSDITSQAIENAQLYQESKKWIKNLQIVTEVSRHLNTKLRVSDIGEYFIEELKRSFDAEGVAICLKVGDATKVLDSSSPYFFTINGKGLLNFINKLFNTGREGILVGDLSRDSKTNYGICSLMSAPLKQEKNIFGFICIVDHRSYHFTFEEFKLFQSLSHHAALAFINAMLRDELEKMVITDYLTKLATRTYLDKKMEESMSNDRKGAFILIDIDNFKRINDRYGHQVGDQVLQQIARIIKRHLYGTDIAARWGGEEIVVYLPNRGLQEGLELAEQLVCRIEKETRPQVTISCGVSSWEEGTRDSPRKLFLRADKALYQAKAMGKNRAMTYTGP